MTISGRITRWNMHKLSSYEQLQYHRERRTKAREDIAKMNSQAQAFNNIQVQKSIAMGDIVSRVAMARMVSKKA
ncbi:hypothetical protein A3840_04045 [Devosia elaeis]|jgi:hypothetical protein|uniref:Uncharacterized protein n=2 Tax=Devosia elaeis TaxID=1770058 RepID=A0A178I2X3_9HYPH|nr:hypothetical protein A3840_04045 [Devosia elaeis]